MSKQSVSIAGFTDYPMKCFILIHKLQHSLKQHQVGNNNTDIYQQLQTTTLQIYVLTNIIKLPFKQHVQLLLPHYYSTVNHL